MSTNEKFDYIIVGGGTAGLVLANRLSTNPNTTVAVIEAGADASSDPRVATPALFTAAIGSELDWAFATVPQEGLNNRCIGHAQGKMLGGTSAINAQCLIPPSASDLDAWEQIVGNEGWNWKLAKYLEKPFSLELPDKETAEHLNTSWAETYADTAAGPVKASFADVKENPIGKAWVQTFEKLGHPLTASPFLGHSTGPYNAASTVDSATKTRSHSGTAYYKPIAERPNLKVFFNSTVEKVLLEDHNSNETPTATSIKFLQDTKSINMTAKKEIILSAGVFNTPKLLELSGIGDPKILHAASIETKVTNPHVGTNLQDHVLAGISFEAQDSISTKDDLARKDVAALRTAMKQYQEHQTGPFSSTGITSFAYLPTIDFTTDRSGPNHPLDAARKQVLSKLLRNGDEGTAQYFLYPVQSTSAGRDTTSSLGTNPQPGNFITLVSALSHPLSTGTVHIASANPLTPPTIDHRYLSNALDLELHARHVGYLETLASSPPFTPEILKPDGKRHHASAFLEKGLDKAKEWVKMASTTNWHSCGTCTMAPKEKGGVVDGELRVYGVQGLRIVDASVFPLIPQSNLQTLVYAVAERAADIILENV